MTHDPGCNTLSHDGACTCISQADPQVDPRMIAAVAEAAGLTHWRSGRELAEQALTAALRAAREAGADKIDTETGRLERGVRQHDASNPECPYTRDIRGAPDSEYCYCPTELVPLDPEGSDDG